MGEESLPRQRREEYIARINRVIDFIERHIDEPLPLERLAGVAYFSPFHFHRIFRALMGETLNQFIQRLRVEKAARQLRDHPRKSVTAIALDCGFSGSAAFARVFKEAFGVSASAWRAGRRRGRGKIGKMTLPAGACAVARFEIRTDEFERAWDSVYGGWLPSSGYQPDDRPCFEVYHNDPQQHPEKKCVVDICVPVKPLEPIEDRFFPPPSPGPSARGGASIWRPPITGVFCPVRGSRFSRSAAQAEGATGGEIPAALA
jgi:AraC-like DNA-binding protein